MAQRSHGKCRIYRKIEGEEREIYRVREGERDTQTGREEKVRERET